jgi:hypothetical protein
LLPEAAAEAKVEGAIADEGAGSRGSRVNKTVFLIVRQGGLLGVSRKLVTAANRAVPRAVESRWGEQWVIRRVMEYRSDDG